MDRRTFLSTLATGLLAAPVAAQGQPAGKVARIGYLAGGTATTNAGFRKAFTDGLRDHGWIEEKNIAIEYRWAGAGQSTLDALAAELARLTLDVIFAVNTPASLATKRTGTTLPVVFAQVSEPVAIGLVDSLARPGRNFTGLTTINRELMSKRLDLLKEAIPGLTRVGYLANPEYEVHKPQLTEMSTAARGLGLTLRLAEVRSSAELEGALRAWRRLTSVPSSYSRTISLSPTGLCSSSSPPSVDCPGCLSSACIHGPAGSCPTEPTPRISTGERRNTWIESSRAPNQQICRSNGLPSSSWRSTSRRLKLLD